MEISIIIQDNSGNWHELDAKDVEIVMTKQFADLEDPSSINAAYTLDAKLPYTEHNNQILKDLYRLDYIYGGSNEFSQKEKHPCIVSHGQDIIYRGTMTIDSAQVNKDKAADNCYNVTIYDEMYDLFTKLDYTLAEPADSFNGTTDKKINIDSLDVRLEPELVTTSFENAYVATDNMHYTNGVCDYYLNPITNELEAANTVGFFPTYKEQDADEEKFAYLTNDGKSLQYWTGGTHNWTEIKDGVPARKYPEVSLMTWKTYDCKPYLYYSAYLDFIFAEIYRTTGYKVNRNTNFFHPTNPYWSNLIRTCKYIKGGSESGASWKTISTESANNKNFHTNKLVEKTANNFTIQGNDKLNLSSFDATTLDVNKKYRLVVKSKITPAFEMHPSTFEINSSYVKVKLDQGNYCNGQILTFLFNGATTIDYNSFNVNMIPDDRTKNNPTNGTNLIYPKHSYKLRNVGHFRDHSEPYVTVPSSDWDCYWWDGDDVTPHCSNMADMQYNTDLIGYEPAFVQYEGVYEYSDVEIMAIKNTGSHNIVIGFETDFRFNNISKSWYYCSDLNGIEAMRWLFRDTHVELQEYSQPTVNYKDLLGDDFNILEAFTQFAKTFNLVVDVDYASKTINLNERGEYYTNYRNSNQGIVIDDWSNNINLKETLEHTAIISEYNAIKYTYEDRETANNVISRNEADVNASTVVRDLELPINSEENNYLEGLYNSYVGKIDTYNIYDFIFNHSRTKMGLDRAIPLYIDKDVSGNGLEDVSGQLLFRHENGINYDYWCVGRNKRPISIVKDTDWEIENDEYVLPLTIANLSTIQFGAMAYTAPSFGIVSEDGNYCSEWINKIGNTTIGNSRGIYDIWHKKWDNIIYGIQGTNQTNKKVTAYFHVPLDQYAAWNFSHLIRIDNNVYIVLSIDEYSFNNGIMKTTLIQITNPYVIGQIDEEFATDYLYVMPMLRRLHKGIGWNTTYKVWCSKPLTYTMETSNYPIWTTMVSAVSFNDIVVGKGYGKELTIIYNTDSATYPTTAQTPYDWVSFDSTDGTFSATYGKVYGKCTNYPQGFDELSPMSITPLLNYVPNAANQSQTYIYTVTSEYPIKRVTDNYNQHSVLRRVSNPTQNQLTQTTYELTISGYSTSGTPGEQMTLTVYNSIGQYCTTVFERENVDYKHEETIEGENGDTDIQRWDYKTVNDPLQSVYRFTLRANYDFDISKWGGQGTMYDGSIGEYCSDPTIKDVILRDMSDPNNPVDYDGETQHFIGQANNTYTLEWHYYRRQGINNTKYSGYFDIRCVGGHSVPAYKKQINVFCNNLNNNP